MPPKQPRSHPEALALYQAILADPDDDTPRLVYADWLDEHDQPARAEFIRLQCRLAHMNEWDEGYTEARVRADRLEIEHGEEWVVRPRGSSGLNFAWKPFVRGFIGKARVVRNLSAAVSHRWYGNFPISHAEFTIRGLEKTIPNFARLANDVFPHLRSFCLDVEYNCPGNSQAWAAHTIATNRGFAGLTKLEIKGIPSLASLENIVASPNLRRLESLTIRGEGFNDDHARLLAVKLNLPALRVLELGHRGITVAGAEALAAAEWFGQLHTLRLLGHEHLGEAGLRVLLGSRALPELRSLSVHYSGPSGTAMELAGGATLPNLQELYTKGGYPTGDELITLANGPQRFASLWLEDARLTVEQARHFFAGPALRELRLLRMPSSFLYPDAVAVLVASPLPGVLRSFTITCGIETEPVNAFLTGPQWPHLERLNLSPLLPGPQSLLALIACDRFPRLVSLCAGCHGSGANFLKKLAKLPAAARFRELELHADLTTIAANDLVESPYLEGIDRLKVAKGRADAASCERLVKRFGKRLEIAGYRPI